MNGSHDKYPPSPIEPTSTGKPHPSYTVKPESQLPDTGSSTPTEYMLVAALFMFALGGAILTRRHKGR